MRKILLSLLLLFVIAVPVAAQAAPDVIVTSFLENWKNRNYDGMYNQISEKSRALTTFPVFETIYQEADIAIGLQDLSFTIQDATIQGTSAAVRYDLTLDSGIYSTINDPGRIMRLVQGPGGWQVAWSTMDIFDGMAAGAQLRSFGQRDPRANIYDREGRLLVEQGGTVISLYLARQDTNEALCLDILADVLQRQRQDLAAFFGRYNAETVFYVGEIDDTVFNARESDLRDACGVRTVDRQTRDYFHGGAVSHITGYIGQIPAAELPQWESKGYSSSDLIGLDGVERAFEEYLSGQPARRLQIVEPGGAVIRELGQTVGSPPQPVTLTIDRDLQVALAEALSDAYNYAEGNWGSRTVSTGAAAIVMDVNTGEILAMSSYPLFEPDVFNPDTLCCTFLSAGERIAELVDDSRTPLLNRVIQQQYSPGSVYKIVTTAAAAAEGLMEPDEIFDCTLTWDGSRFGDDVGFERVDWRLTDGLEATGPVTIAQALTASCDPFFYQMGAVLFNQVDPAALVDYSLRMGLGESTGINYYGPEAIGDLAMPASASEAINNAIGQGDVKVSPIQMARLVASVANGGTVYRPYLVQKIGGVDFTPVALENEPEVVGEIGVSESVLDVVKEGMCGVTTIEDLGTAVSSFGNAPYLACGKTGTAQTGGYPHAWFVAYAPAENPQIAVAVIAEQSREGADVAAPIVRRIMDSYFDVPLQDFPLWWFEDDYNPVEIPEGATGG